MQQPCRLCLCLTTFCNFNQKNVLYKYLLLLSFNFSKPNFRSMFIFLRYTWKGWFSFQISLIIAYTEPLVKESLHTVFVLPKIWKRFYYKRFIFIYFLRLCRKQQFVLYFNCVIMLLTLNSNLFVHSRGTETFNYVFRRSSTR